MVKKRNFWPKLAKKWQNRYFSTCSAQNILSKPKNSEFSANFDLETWTLMLRYHLPNLKKPEISCAVHIYDFFFCRAISTIYMYYSFKLHACNCCSVLYCGSYSYQLLSFYRSTTTLLDLQTTNSELSGTFPVTKPIFYRLVFFLDTSSYKPMLVNFNKVLSCSVKRNIFSVLL